MTYIEYEKEEGDYRIRIMVDEDSLNPRKDWDSSLGRMICFHKRYDLGDAYDLKSENFSGWDEMEGYLYEEEEALVLLPLYLYDHSGITMRTSPFSCPWDSGQVGFIYATRKMILEWYGKKQITQRLRAQAVDALLKEVEIYDQYLRGDVYGFELSKAIEVGNGYEDEDDRWEEINSCWGFFGTNWNENGLAEHLPEEGRGLLP